MEAAAEPGRPAYHPLAYHGLDVAACGLALCRARPALLSGIARASGLAPELLLGWLTFLLSIHDLGKMADGFQALAPALMQQLQGRSPNPGYPERHDTLGYRLWLLLAQEELARQDGLLPRGPLRLDFRDAFEPWLGAVFGHHGRPVCAWQLAPDLARQFPPLVCQEALALWQTLGALLLPAGASFEIPASDEGLARFQRASWLVAGFANLADWLGSNEAWFPFAEPRLELAAYWREWALPRAERALAETGLAEQPVRRATGLRALWPSARFASLTPLQQLAEEVELAPGPQLFVIEEVTGGGKTEAALTLAHRLMAADRAGELYFALPSMATANAMHQRVSAMFRQLYDEGARPNLVLAHGKTHLQLGWAETPRDRAYAQGDTTASQDCAAWLADSRKKALLAQVGVGTVDQALMAILQLRHQGLRLCGLVGKVLVVDEVHACDDYVHKLLLVLLRFHAAFGGSAILLSATLPNRARQELAAAFAEGLGAKAPELSEGPYPLLTRLGRTEPLEMTFAARPDLRRRVEVRWLSSMATVANYLWAGLEGGGCACWIRNTVDDAQEAYEEWRERLGEERVTLFHARFTVADRRRREQEVLRRFGPDSTAAERAGQLLIATQVAEQSLDLDFDDEVADLATIDRLVQRAGRLKRHARDRQGNRRAGPDLREPPVLAVFGPQPTPSPGADWYSSVLPRAAYVYPNLGQLWLTAEWLAEHGGFTMPEDARSMIESVFPKEEPELPEALTAKTYAAEGEGKAHRSVAQSNSLAFETGYRSSGQDWLPEADTPTRLGEPTVSLRLAREGPGGWQAWHAGELFEWEQSEIQVRRARVAGEDPTSSAETVAELKAQMPDEGRGAVVVLMIPSEAGWVGRAVDGRRRTVTLNYDEARGLRVSACFE